MRRIPLFAIRLFIISGLFVFACAQDSSAALRRGSVNAENINVRSDSTVGSPAICSVSKGQKLRIVSERYSWYKISLPKQAPSFVSKSLVKPVAPNPSILLRAGKNTARALSNNINIRLAPDLTSPILGKINKNEIVNILEDLGEWYKIEPTLNSFGWIHKKFVDLIEKTEEEQQIASESGLTVIEGIIRPYGRVFKRVATHKLITADNNIFLLKGNRSDLNALTYHKVKVTGKLISSPKKRKYQLIEIMKMEALN